MLDAYKKAAAQLISLKSVSADSTCAEDIKKTAEFLLHMLQEAGFKTQLFEGYANPIVYGEYSVDPTLKTALIYGHYDVQPASREDGWTTDPFVMVEKDGKLFGRGIMDDKCQLLIHIIAIIQLIKNNKLGYNIKFVFEGNEEVGSPAIEDFITDHKDLLSCDFILFSDGEMAHGKPTLELSTRGILNCTLTVRTSINEVHSGIFGGAIPVATHELSNFIAGLVNQNNRITIDGFYDDVDTVDTSYSIPFDMESFKKNSGANVVITEPDSNFYTQTGLLPSVTVTGMYGGYIGEGNKSIIPATATAKLNFRIVKSQKKEDLIEKIKKYVQKVLPSYVTYTLDFTEFAEPFKSDKNNEYVQLAADLLEKVYGDKPYYKYVGGTEPVLIHFQQILQKPIVAVPFANDDGFMHGANENFNIANIEKGLEFSERFFGKK